MNPAPRKNAKFERLDEVPEPPRLLTARPRKSKKMLSHCFVESTLPSKLRESTADHKMLELYRIDFVCAPASAIPANNKA
mmetsp:Transcript_100165/g.188722  ORF Transcript_100165/g.188722 Transcript_100165/m.188722 type:complete len:80 (+) Transcript_100165:691-930(+)